MTIIFELLNSMAHCLLLSAPTLTRNTMTQDTTNTDDQINRRSKNITEGTARAPNRSMYYAMGYESEDFKKPMVCHLYTSDAADDIPCGDIGGRRTQR